MLASLLGIILGFVLNWLGAAIIGIEKLSYFPGGNTTAQSKFNDAWQAYKAS